MKEEEKERKVKNLVKVLPLFLVLVLSVASCKTSKFSGTGGKAEYMNDLQYLKDRMEDIPSFQTFSSKMKLSLQGSGKELNISGSLRIKRDEVIQLSFVPLLGIEVARIDIMPEKVLIIDRLHKRYMEAPVSLLQSLGNTKLDFYVLQALFLNEFFVPGVKQLSEKDLKDFVIGTRTEDEIIYKLQEKGKLNYNFIVSLPVGVLKESSIIAGNNNRLDWQYGEFRELEKKKFPAIMDIILKRNDKTDKVNLQLSRMSTKENVEIQTNIPKKYRRVDINEFINLLFSL